MVGMLILDSFVDFMLMMIEGARIRHDVESVGIECEHGWQRFGLNWINGCFTNW